MDIPKTTEDNPYIEFEFDSNGLMSLSISDSWWGGKKGGFFRSNGKFGNTCRPEELKEYIDAFKKRKIKSFENELNILKNKIELLKSETII